MFLFLLKIFKDFKEEHLTFKRHEEEAKQGSIRVPCVAGSRYSISCLHRHLWTASISPQNAFSGWRFAFPPSFLFPRRRSGLVGSLLVIICISAPKRFNLLSGDVGQIKLRANWHGREDSGFLSPVGFERRSADEAEPGPAGRRLVQHASQRRKDFGA